MLAVLRAQLCPTLCGPMDCSPPGSSVHGVLQARTLERVAISYSRGSFWPREPTWVSCIAGRFFTIVLPKGYINMPPNVCVCVCVCVLVAQSCPTLCDPMDCNLLGSSVHGILQARTLEWVVIPFSRELPNPGNKPGPPALQADSLPSEAPGKMSR